MTRRLGAWDCPYCSTKQILGNVFDCPGCGHPRPRGIQFYQIPDGPFVTSEIAAQLGSGGPNWYCEHCESGNKDNNTRCWNCGAERGSSPTHEVKNYLQDEHVPQTSEEAKTADPDGESWVNPPRYIPEEPITVHDLESEGPQINSIRQSAVTSYLQRAKEIILPQGADIDTIKPYAIWAAVLTVLGIMSILVYQLFFNTREEMVQISAFNWNQTTSVQEYQAVRETSWTSHPVTAYNIVQDYRDTGRDERVHDGWETVEYLGTCYETVSYQDTCTDSKYVSHTCIGTQDNGDGSFETYDFECGGDEPYTYPCVQTRQEPYPCTKTRDEELYHYEDIYDWYYTYDIDKWVTIANYATSGNDHEPYFYSGFELNNPYDEAGSPQLGQQRQSQIPEKYTATFFCKRNVKVGDEGYFTREYSLHEWEMLEYEVDYPIEINAFNGIVTYPNP